MQQIRARWQQLPGAHKVFLIALPFAVLSVFLPWFGDQNQFTLGSVALGINGPTAFIGYNILVLTTLTLLHEVYYLVKNKFLLGSETGLKLMRFLPPINLYLAVIAYSIYLHPEVGTNLLAKKSYFGFYLSIVSSLFLFSSYLIPKLQAAKPMRRSLKGRSPQREQFVQKTESELDTSALSATRKHNSAGLTIEDVIPEHLPINHHLRQQWEKQRDLEKKMLEDADS